MCSIGLGNGCGLIWVPKVGTIVIAGFIKNSEYPIIIGTIYDTFSTIKDYRFALEQGDALIVNQTNGAYIYLKNDNTIKLKEPNGEYILLNSSGVKASNYNSSDGTIGATEDVVITEDGGSTKTLHFKNGLYIGYD